jgi:hypothetical protein
LENLRKKINMKNKTQINLTKSTILNIFSTKNTMVKKDDDYYEEKKEKKNKKISNAIEEENDKLNVIKSKLTLQKKYILKIII